MQLIIAIMILLLCWPTSANAATTGTMDYDAATHRYKFYNGTSWVSMGVNLGLIGCSEEGAIEYDGLIPTMKWCNGTVWKSFQVTLTLNICSTAGQWRYNSGATRYEFCNGLLWSYMS
jgi:hypothetical protein